MDSITLEDYRCFREKQTADLAPLTLLVGENSTGKTSFLALIRALQDIEFEGILPNFKKEPYDLGSFAEIAHYRGGKGGRADTFRAGFDLTIRNWRSDPEFTKPSDPEFIKSSYAVTFDSKGTAPFPIKRRLDCGDIWIEEKTETENSEDNKVLCFGTENGSWKLSGLANSIGITRYGREISPISNAMRYFLQWITWTQENPEDPAYEVVEGHSHPCDEDIKLLEKYADPLSLNLLRYDRVSGRVLASAPVRFKPFRTYDPFPVERDPEGLYIPFYLAEIQDEKNWESLQEAIQKFGQDSGLFDEISVRRLGKGSSDPFQLQIKKYGAKAKGIGAKGPKRNLIDVGYGVSQVLPVVTELLSRELPTIFLTQQPEVHLHPKAQAALGSLLCKVASSGHQLVVETHSDYILDRIRMEVRAENPSIKPEDVSILYFESGNLDVKIHSLKLDEHGDITNAPSGYREFFRKETRRLLGM